MNKFPKVIIMTNPDTYDIFTYYVEECEDGYSLSSINSDYMIDEEFISKELYESQKENIVTVGFLYNGQWMFDASKAFETCVDIICNPMCANFYYQSVLSDFAALIQ